MHPRKTKIAATLGPSSGAPLMILNLAQAGVNVFRLNFSHGTYDTHQKNVNYIREAEKALKVPLGIMADLQGPKLRVGVFELGSVILNKEAKITLDLDPTPGNETRVCLPHPEIIAALEVGDFLLLVDGKIKLCVLEKSADKLVAKVIIGGKLSDHQGVNIPHKKLPISALTPKDLKDLEFIKTLDVDFIALSFVQHASDIVELRQIIGNQFLILAKIEKPQAIYHLDDILVLADGVMVARGDLGVELPIEDVPSLQKQIILKAQEHGKPVVVATQMLESMINAPTPTRAEVSDVANAVYEGADATMLSGETAAGSYPLEAVQVMRNVIQKTEISPQYRPILTALSPMPESTVADAITSAAKQMAVTIGASAIVTVTATGNTTIRAARLRPMTPILGLTPTLKVARHLTLNWGVIPFVVPDTRDFDQMVLRATEVAKMLLGAGEGDQLVLTGGKPLGIPGTTNFVQVQRI